MRKRELPADNNTGKFNMSAEFLEPATINCWTLYAIPGEVRGVGNQRFQMSDFGYARVLLLKENLKILYS